MFEVVRESEQIGAKRWLFDKSRDVRVEAKRFSRDDTVYFIMTWGDRVIPFETRIPLRPPIEPNGFPKFPVRQIMVLGDTAHSHTRPCPPYTFTSPEEYKEALEIAAEALIVFGYTYDGLNYGDGYWTVEYRLDDEIIQRQMSDYGYETIELTKPYRGWELDK